EPFPGGPGAGGGGAKPQTVFPPAAAPPGKVTVTATAGSVHGTVTFNITPGAATVKVQTVLMQISDATCGSDIGGSLTLSAIVFDADNNPVNDVNLLFITPIGEVIPLTNLTDTINGQARVTPP